MELTKKNEIKFYTTYTLYSTAFIIASSSVLQTFLLEVGINESSVTGLVSFFQIMQSITMMLCSSFADRIKNVIKATAVSMLNLLLMFIPMLFFSVDAGHRSAAAIVFFVLGGLSSFVLGFYNVIFYKLPFHVLNMDHYGRITANGGILHGITGISVSAIMTYFIGKYEYFFVMRIIILIAIALVISAFLVAMRYKQIPDFAYEAKGKKKINIFRYKPFLKLFIPNFTRGVGNGIIEVSVTIGYFFEVIDKVGGGYIVMITNAAVILSCLIFSKISAKGRNGLISFVSSIVILLVIPFMLIGKHTVVFLCCYGISYLAANVLGFATPVLVTELVDYDVLGEYTAWRMMLFAIGSAVGGTAAIPLAKAIGGIPLFILAGLLFFTTGFGYFYYEKKSKAVHI